MEMVLIETLWNVKKVEKTEDVLASIVLIETLWNVKEAQDVFQRSARSVLIETLWNVKTDLYNVLNVLYGKY